MFSNSKIRQQLNNFLLQALKIGSLLKRRNLQKLGNDYVELEVKFPNIKYLKEECEKLANICNFVRRYLHLFCRFFRHFDFFFCLREFVNCLKY